MGIYEQWRDRIMRPAMEDFAQAIGEGYQEEIESPQWTWLRVTKRKSGAVVGSPRDIVDLGNLKNSQQLFISETDLEFHYVWDGNGETPAVTVHEGIPDKGYLPRRWTQSFHNRVDLARLMKSHYDKYNP